MSARHRLTPQLDQRSLQRAAQARILYADTDKLGIVYHAAYFRYLELARVELVRGAGMPYTLMEAEGLALPLVELAVSFAAPGLYDDRISIYAGLSLVTWVRVHFQYRVVVEPGDREGLGPGSEPVELLRAETRHCCMHRDTQRPTRLPEPMYERLYAMRARPR
jgi:acyl-CoA thioester hydrolase